MAGFGKGLAGATRANCGATGGVTGARGGKTGILIGFGAGGGGTRFPTRMLGRRISFGSFSWGGEEG